MPKQTPAEAAKIILESDFGNDSEIEDLSDKEGGNEEAMPMLDKVHNDLVGNAPAVDETSNVPALALNEIPDEEPLAKKDKKKSKNFLKKKEFIPAALAEEICDASPNEPVSAYTYFKIFLPSSLIENIFEKTNMYYVQMHGKDLKATPQEINTLLGMHFEMGSVPFPNMRLYLSK